MKKQLFTVLPLVTVLVLGIGFNVYRLYNSKTKYAIVSKTYWGFSVELYSKKGANRAFICLKHKGDATFGNLEKTYMVWAMN